MNFDPSQMINMLGGMANFNQRINSFGNNFRQQFGPNADPQQIGQQLLNSGQISQEQFEKARQVANFITGKNF